MSPKEIKYNLHYDDVSLQSCGAANTIVCMRNAVSLPTARQKTKPLPYKLP